jgi:hypothetical protein
MWSAKERMPSRPGTVEEASMSTDPAKNERSSPARCRPGPTAVCSPAPAISSRSPARSHCWWRGGGRVPLLLTGVLLFGAGIGNTTSLPPLIAQVEFVEQDVARVVPMIVAIGQGTYAFAPASFGLIRELAPQAPIAANAAPHLFVAAAAIQAAAIAAFLLGRRGRACSPGHPLPCAKN